MSLVSRTVKGPGELWSLDNTTTAHDGGVLTVTPAVTTGSTIDKTLALWSIDALEPGEWHDCDGTPWAVPYGTHTVTFKSLDSGFSAPTSQSVTFDSSNKLRQITPTFGINNGVVTLSLASGPGDAPWSATMTHQQTKNTYTVDNTTAGTPVRLVAGTYDVVFSEVPNWTKPADFSFFVDATTPMSDSTRSYTMVTQTIKLHCTNIGSNGRFDLLTDLREALVGTGITVLNSSQVTVAIVRTQDAVIDVGPGTYTVRCPEVPGWSAPVDATITVASNNTAITHNVTYTATHGYLRVIPNIDIAGDCWRLSTEPDALSSWRKTGIYQRVGTNNITLVYKSVGAAYTTPSNYTLAVAAGTTSTVTPTYTKVTAPTGRGFLKVTSTTGDVGCWRVKNQAGYSWIPVTTQPIFHDLPTGTHTIEFGYSTGRVTPADVSVTISNSAPVSLPVSYKAAQFKIRLRILDCSTGRPVQGVRWRPWNSTGPWFAAADGETIATGYVSSGEMLIEYAPIAGFVSTGGGPVNISMSVSSAVSHLTAEEQDAWPITVDTAFFLPRDLSITKTNVQNQNILGGVPSNTGFLNVRVWGPRVATTGTPTMTNVAAWALNGSSRWVQSNGVSVLASSGNYTLAFKPVTGYTTPSNVAVTVTNGYTTPVDVLYVPTGGSWEMTIEAGRGFDGFKAWWYGSDLQDTPALDYAYMTCTYVNGVPTWYTSACAYAGFEIYGQITLTWDSYGVTKTQTIGNLSSGATYWIFNPYHGFIQVDNIFWDTSDYIWPAEDALTNCDSERLVTR